MIKDNAQAVIEDVNGTSGIVLEVNFDENLKDCVKISIDGNSRIIKYTDLFAFMFTLATKEQQAKMIPVQQELGTEYMKTIKLRVKKDMKEGEIITVHTKIHVPTVVEQQVLWELEQKNKLSTEAVETPYLTHNTDAL